MKKLSELIRIKAVVGNIEVPCQVDTSHESRVFVEISVPMPHGEFEALKDAVKGEMDRPIALKTRCCPVCWVQFMADCATEASVLSGEIQRGKN